MTAPAPVSQAKIPQITVLDTGGQYCHLIARRVRELGVYSEVRPSETPASELEGSKGLIISGGPEVEALLSRIVGSGSIVAAPTQQYQRHRLSAPVRYVVDQGLLISTGWDTFALPSAVGKALLGGHVIIEFHPRPADVFSHCL